MFRSVSAIIPAAGNSARMGRDKALLPMADGLTFAGHLVNCFGVFGCKPVVLVVNDRFDPGGLQANNFITVVNHYLDKGRSYSIHLGLKHLHANHGCFVQNVDNPFLEPALLDKLLEASTPDSFTVPVYNRNGGHPVLLGAKVVDFFRRRNEIFDFRQMLLRFPRVEVPWADERILWNINTPDDYKMVVHWEQCSHKKL